jgi:hypothetical protein
MALKKCFTDRNKTYRIRHNLKNPITHSEKVGCKRLAEFGAHFNCVLVDTASLHDGRVRSTVKRESCKLAMSGCRLGSVPNLGKIRSSTQRLGRCPLQADQDPVTRPANKVRSHTLVKHIRGSKSAADIRPLFSCKNFTRNSGVVGAEVIQ